MRAATIRDREIVIADHPDPSPGAGEVLVRVRAAGLNGADQMQVLGHYPPPPGLGVPEDIPGLELAGEVAEVGPNATRFSPGDRVMAVVAGAGQAELAVVHQRQLMPVPDGLGWPGAGGFPEAFMTAYDAIFGQGGLQAGETLLVHGAAGGVGTAAVQLGATAGARVIATVRSPGKRDAVAALGADQVIAPEGFADHGPFDVIIELVGAGNLADNVRSLAYRRPHRDHRGRRRRQRRARPARVDDQARPDQRLDAARPPAGGQGGTVPPAREAGPADGDGGPDPGSGRGHSRT